MKQDRITKLYGKLTNKERAALAFHHLTNVNEAELERVVATVPRETYECLDMEYRRWLNGFFDMGALWAIEHWRSYSRKLAALGELFLMARKEPDKVQDMWDTHEECESYLLALDRALLTVCEEHGIDPDAVRRMAGADPFVPMFAMEPSAEHQATMRKNLSRLLEGGRRSFPKIVTDADF
jgi:hypothetical protein